MTTQKLRFFEYAGHTEEKNTDQIARHVHRAFDTPNGFAFVVAGNGSAENSDSSLAQIANERLKYYLVNEVLGDPAEAVRNAIIYANGFIHVLLEKQPELQDAELSCMCVLVKDNKVYYAWVGQVCLYLYEGKKLVPLSWELFHDGDEHALREAWKMSFLGQKQMIVPGVCRQPLVPIEGDILLMATSGLCLQLDEKHIKKILGDSMPAHTKAARLLCKAAEEELSAACQIIRFYNIKEEVRTFTPGAMVAASGKKAAEPRLASGRLNKSVVQWAVVVVTVCALMYMVYDLFLFDPRPPARIESVAGNQTDAAKAAFIDSSDLGDTESRSLEAVAPAPDKPPTRGQTPSDRPAASTPQDVLYVVKPGDNWGRIYREFEVCSWFIVNHPPNRSKFDAGNQLVAGAQLAIPIMYSAKQNLNPYFYQEFSISKVGGSCQNVTNAFLDQVQRKMNISR